MSVVVANALQVGQSGTATNNFTLYQPLVADGTVRLANGNTGSTTDLITVTSAGNVGIGAAPSAQITYPLLQVGGQLGLWSAPGSNNFIYSNSYFGSGSANKYIANGYAHRIYFSTNGGAMTFDGSDTGTAGAGVTYTGLMSIGKGTSLALQGAALATGTGITFPATQNASSDANTLDDYEEGTWAPSVGGNATYLTQQGQYIKMGRFVYIQGKINISAIGTGSTSVITNLPFQATYDAGSIGGGGTTIYFSNLAVNAISLTAAVGPNTTNLAFDACTTSGTTISGYTAAVFGNNTRIDFTATYMASS